MKNVSREELIRALPYARRYARALTGSQATGDSLVAASLKDVLAGDTGEHDEPRAALYGSVTRRFNHVPRAQAHLNGLTLQQRQLLLLTSLEEMTIEVAAPIVSMPLPAAAEQLHDARRAVAGVGSHLGIDHRGRADHRHGHRGTGRRLRTPRGRHRRV